MSENITQNLYTPYIYALIPTTCLCAHHYTSHDSVHTSHFTCLGTYTALHTPHALATHTSCLGTHYYTPYIAWYTHDYTPYIAWYTHHMPRYTSLGTLDGFVHIIHIPLHTTCLGTYHICLDRHHMACYTPYMAWYTLLHTLNALVHATTHLI